MKKKKNHSHVQKKSETLLEIAIRKVEGFGELHSKLVKSFTINGKSRSTLINYTRCLAHLALHYNRSPETLDKEAIDDYLFYCKNHQNSPSESFFKHTVYGLRAVYKIMGLDQRKVQLPEIKRDKSLPEVLSLGEMKRLILAPKYLKHRLMIATLYGCGLRSYELCALKLSDVDFERRTVFIKSRKEDSTDMCPLATIWRVVLKNILPQKIPTSIFLIVKLQTMVSHCQLLYVLFNG